MNDVTIEQALKEKERRQLLKAALAEKERRAQSSADQLPEHPETTAEKFQNYRQGAEDFLNAGVDVGKAALTSAVAEPVSGLLGIMASNWVPGITPHQTGQVVEGVQDKLTAMPSSESGQQALQWLGDKLEPVVEMARGVSQGTGDYAYDKTGSALAGSLGYAAPAAAIEAGSFGVGKTLANLVSAAKRAPANRSIDRAMKVATPSQSELKTSSSSLFKEVDDLGVVVRKEPFQSLVNDIQAAMMDAGADVSAPKSWGVLERLRADAEMGTLTLPEIERLHKVAGGAAKSPDKHEAMLGMIAKEKIDNFLEELSPDDLIAGQANANKVGALYRKARDQWGRMRRSELVTDAVKSASVAASGWENGIRNEMRSLHKKIVKGKIRGFTDKEIFAIDRIANGSPGSNIARYLGMMGVAGGSLGNNWLSTMLIGGSGIISGNVLPALTALGVGTAFKVLSQRMTRGNAAFADQIIRAGKDARKITEVYMRNTPSKKRSAQELSLLLMNKDIDLSPLSRFRMEAEAARLALENRGKLVGVLAGSATRERDGASPTGVLSLPQGQSPQAPGMPTRTLAN